MWFWLLMALVLFFGGCVAIVAGTGKAINDANTQKHTIVYSVTGSGTADINYDAFDNGKNNGSSSITNVPLPWTKTITGSGLFNSYSVGAYLKSSGGTVSCTLSIDGKQVSSHTSSGAYGSVSCRGNAP